MTIDLLVAEMDKALQFPGVSNAWTMPIKARIDMLSTGIRTPVGVKVFGTDLSELDRIGREIEHVLKSGPGTSSAYGERVIGGYYLNIVPNREALARYGLMVADVQNSIAMALGGEALTTTVEGRERYAVNMRYPRDLRSSPQSIASDLLIALPTGSTVPSGEVATVSLAAGRRPSAPKTVNWSFMSMLTSAIEIWAATSPTRRKRLRQTPTCRRAIMSAGAANSSIWSVQQRGCESSFPLRC